MNAKVDNVQIPTAPRGFLLEGFNKGLKTKDNVDQESGEIKKTIYVGIAIPKENGFDDEVDIIQIKVSETLIKNGYPAAFNQHRNDFIRIPVYVRHWSMGGRSGVSYSVSNDEIELLRKAL